MHKLDTVSHEPLQTLQRKLGSNKMIQPKRQVSMWIQVHVIDSSTEYQQLLKCLEKMWIGHVFRDRSWRLALANELWAHDDHDSETYCQFLALAAAFLVDMAMH